MTTHYQSSKGPKLIADMAYPHLAAAHAKLVRERQDASRDAEIAAMKERLDVMDAEYAAESAVAHG